MKIFDRIPNHIVWHIEKAQEEFREKHSYHCHNAGQCARNPYERRHNPRQSLLVAAAKALSYDKPGSVAHSADKCEQKIGQRSRASDSGERIFSEITSYNHRVSNIVYLLKYISDKHRYRKTYYKLKRLSLCHILHVIYLFSFYGQSQIICHTVVVKTYYSFAITLLFRTLTAFLSLLFIFKPCL